MHVFAAVALCLMAFQSCTISNLEGEQSDRTRQRHRWPRTIELDYQDYVIACEPETEVVLLSLLPPDEKGKSKIVIRLDLRLPGEYGNLLWVKMKTPEFSERMIRLQKGAIKSNVPGNYFFNFGDTDNMLQIYIEADAKSGGQRQLQIALTDPQKRVVIVHRHLVVQIAKANWLDTM